MHKKRKIKYDWTGVLYFILIVVLGIALDYRKWR